MLALVVMVGYDRLAGSPAGDDGGSLRSVYLQKASLVASQVALLDQRDNWERAHGDAESKWSALSERVIVRQSEEIAQGELRERLTRHAQELGLQRPETRPLATLLPGDEDEDEPTTGVRIIQLSVTVRSDDWERVYRLVDRIETDPRTVSRVTALTLSGPGLAQMTTELEASMTVQALALVEQADGGAR